MMIPTEPIGSIPRPLRLIEQVAAQGGTNPALDALYEEAVRDTIRQFEATGSPVITDGEQRKYHNFWTYCVEGLHNTDCCRPHPAPCRSGRLAKCRTPRGPDPVSRRKCKPFWCGPKWRMPGWGSVVASILPRSNRSSTTRRYIRTRPAGDRTYRETERFSHPHE
jgi:hypothetical protein